MIREESRGFIYYIFKLVGDVMTDVSGLLAQ